VSYIIIKKKIYGRLSVETQHTIHQRLVSDRTVWNYETSYLSAEESFFDDVSQLRCLPSTIAVYSPLKIYGEMSSSASDTDMSRSSWTAVRRHVANLEQQFIGTEMLTEPEV
jgi:hypothetical protein